MAALPKTLHWKPLRLTAEATFAEFEIGDLLEPRQLASIGLPADARGREHLGLILSGRGPIWLYAHLTHLAHPFAWLALHDPRLNGAVVVCRHRPDAPPLGAIVPLPQAE